MDTQRSSHLPARTTAIPLSSVGKGATLPAFEVEEDSFNVAQPLIILRRRLGIVLGVTVSLLLVSIPAAFWAVQRKPPQYAGTFQLLVEPITAEEQLKRLTLDSQQGPGEGLQTAPTELDYPTQIQILQSPKILLPIVKKIQTKYPSYSYDSLVSNLTIWRVLPKGSKKDDKGTKILGVNYQDTDPELTRTVIQELANAFLKYSLEDRQTNIDQGIKFIDTQLPQLQQRVNGLQKQLQDFRQQYGIINPDVQGEQAASQSGSLEQQQFDMDAKLAESKTHFGTLQKDTAQSNNVTVLAESPQYQALLNKYQDIQSQIALEAARSREENPALQSLRDKQRNLEGLLRQEAQRVLGKAGDDITVLQARNQAIQQSKGQVEQKIQQYPSLARQYTDLDRELKVATNSLSEFLSKREGLQIDAAQKVVPWELVSPPTLATDPTTGEPLDVSPNLLINYIGLAVFASLVMGIVAGFLVDTSSNAYHTSKAVSQFTKLPLLGLIPLKGDIVPVKSAWWRRLPFLKRKRQASSARPPIMTATATAAELNGASSGYSYTTTSLFIEAFRSLYKNIRLLPLQAPVRSLTISSAEPGDGKSTIAVNLAQVAAAMGKRVLLVDADLRQPQVHRLLGLPNHQGLSDIIANNVNVREVLQPSPTKENLMILTAGQVPDDPTKILTSGKMQLLMERFQMVFDLVIYDTPPLVGLADSSLIAAQTDGLALVVMIGKTKRPSLSEALEEVKLSATTVLGVIANGVKDAPMPYAYHYQSQPQANAVPVELEPQTEEL